MKYSSKYALVGILSLIRELKEDLSPHVVGICKLSTHTAADVAHSALNGPSRPLNSSPRRIEYEMEWNDDEPPHAFDGILNTKRIEDEDDGDGQMHWSIFM